MLPLDTWSADGSSARGISTVLADGPSALQATFDFCSLPLFRIQGCVLVSYNTRANSRLLSAIDRHFGTHRPRARICYSQRVDQIITQSQRHTGTPGVPAATGKERSIPMASLRHRNCCDCPLANSCNTAFATSARDRIAVFLLFPGFSTFCPVGIAPAIGRST